MTENERRTKFVELAEKRVAKALKQIRLIGNLSNRGNYSYTAKDADKIVAALNREIKAMKRRFEEGGSSDQPEFRL